MKHLHNLLVLPLLVCACGPETPCDDPEEVVESFYASMTYGDTKMAHSLVTGADRRSLAERAEKASKVTGKKMSAHEMLVPGLVELEGDLLDAKFAPVKVEVGDVEEVEVTLRDGRTIRTPVVMEASCYRIPLGLAAGETVPTGTTKVAIPGE